MWYLLLSHRDLPPVDDVSRDKACEGHFAFLRTQHNAGKVLFSGPTADRSMGIYVIKADPHDDAVAITDEDPLHTYKARRPEVVDWDVHQIMRAGFAE